MYRFEESYLKPANPTIPYGNYATGSTRMNELFDSYVDGYLKFSHRDLDHPQYIELSTLRKINIQGGLNQSINLWLNRNGNRRLPSGNTPPSYRTTKMYARDAILAGFKVDPCVPYQDHKTGASIGGKTNLYLQTNYLVKGIAGSRFLTTVNGMMHRNFPFGEGCQIVDGGKSSMHYKARNVGIWSFEHIGDVKQYPFTDENIFKVSPAIPYSKGFMIRLGKDISNKSLVLSLGGYPHVNPSFAKVVNAEIGLIAVDMTRVDVATAILQSRKRIDLTDLGIWDATDTDNESYSKINLREMAADVVIRKWLLLPQSFVAVVDAPDLTVTEHSSHWTGLYGAYEYHENPYLPLRDNFGRSPEYWVKKQHEAWVVLVEDTEYRPYLTLTTNQDELDFRNDAIPYHAPTELPMSFLEITSTKKLEPTKIKRVVGKIPKP